MLQITPLGHRVLTEYIKQIETLVSPARHLIADPPGVITGGYGETDPSLVHEGMEVGETLAQNWLDATLQKFEDGCNAIVHPLLTEGQSIAVLDFAYNEGLHALAKSTLAEYLNKQMWAAAGAEFAKWDMANGIHLAGLEKRRLVELNWFENKVNFMQTSNVTVIQA